MSHDDFAGLPERLQPSNLPEPPAAKAKPPGRDPVRRTAECDVDYNLIAQQAEQIAALQQDAENGRMQLAAIMAAALGNTRTSVADRLTRENPYWSASYGDVCKAVDREMHYRERAEQLEAQNRALREWLWEETIAHRMRNHDGQFDNRCERCKKQEALATPGIAPATPTEQPAR